MKYLPNISRHFNYQLTGLGWAKATFGNDKQIITFDVSYLSDPLFDLCEALCRLLENETRSEKIFFADEPGEHRLDLSIIETGKLRVEIYWSDDWEGTATVPTISTAKKLIYEDIDTLKDFIMIVVLGIDALLESTTIEGYKDKWHLFDFPENSYNKLKQLVQHA